MFSTIFSKLFNCIFGFFLISFFFLSSQNFAGSGEDDKEDKVSKEGSWALQFSIGNNFNLSSFQGSMVSAQYHFTEKSAIRFGLSPSVRFQDVENDRNSTQSDTISNHDDDNAELTKFSIQIDAQYIYYGSKSNWVNFYFGAGPRFQISHENQESTDNQYPDDDMIVIYETESEYDTWGAGLSGTVGVEIPVTNFMAFLAEYNCQILYMSNESKQKSIRYSSDNDPEYKREQEQNSSQNYVNFSSTNVRLGVSIYF